MKILLFALSYLFISTLKENISAQTKTPPLIKNFRNIDYVVLANNDTVVISIKKYNHHKIVGAVNGRRTKYKAKNIVSFRVDGEYKESGRIRYMVIGFKRWLFMDRAIDGKVKLCELPITDRTLSSTPDNPRRVPGFIYYYRKAEEPRGVYHKLWAWYRLDEFLNDCPTYIKKIEDEKNQREKSREYLFEKVQFYNENCPVSLK